VERQVAAPRRPAPPRHRSGHAPGQELYHAWWIRPPRESTCLDIDRAGSSTPTGPCSGCWVLGAETHSATVYQVVADDPEEIDRRVNLVLNSPTPAHGRAAIRRKDGTLVDVSVSAASSASAGGR